MSPRDLIAFIAGAVLPSLLLSWLVTWLVRFYAPRWGLIDQPNAARKVHTTPTPLGGGLGIWAGVVGAFALGQLALLLADSSAISHLVPEFARPHLAGLRQQAPQLWILLGGGTTLMLLGLWDDRRGLSWQVRLATQFAVATACVLLVPRMQLTAFLPWQWLTILLSVLWIVTLVNSFNFLDNMDALSGGIAAIASAMLAAVLLLAPDPTTNRPQLFVAGLLLVLLGGVLGFLYHNRPPARIFMGDAGSYFLGFLIAAATLLSTYAGYHSASRHAILAPLCVMAVPLYDIATVMAIRLLNGKSPFQPDKNHFSHRLVDLGMTRPQAVATVHLTTATCGLGALLLHRVDAIGAALVMLMIGGILCLIGILEAAARQTIRKHRAG
jgi:UDP-GlcNAc:undecaprenyl-phosphate GlcNAc-1-phosphate transferase